MEKPEFKAELTLSKEEVEQAIKQYVTANMAGVDADKVTLNIGIVGGDTPGVPQPIFNFAVVTVTPKAHKPELKPRLTAY